jgi:hypothetical protein
MQIACFWLEGTLRARRSLRRYSREGSPDAAVCKQPWGYHNAHALIDDVPFEIKPSGVRSEYRTFDFLGADKLELFPAEDPRWPAKCEHCDYRFEDGDKRQVFIRPLYRRIDTSEELILDDAPPGAMWDAWWYGDSDFPTPPRPDGIHLMVRCPGFMAEDGSHADWYVDGIAGNGDRNSYGWSRSGIPNQHPPSVTANPSIQITQTNGYHGRLKSGFLVPA